MRRGAGPVAALALLLPLAACGSGVLVDAYPTEPGTDGVCGPLLADLPVSVDGLERRDLDEDVPAATWGDPPVVLRCGVPTPEAFGPTSVCDVVDGVDWFSEPTADGFLFTTVGRAANVSVDVPAVHDPAADVLVDLSESIETHVPVVRPCQG